MIVVASSSRSNGNMVMSSLRRNGISPFRFFSPTTFIRALMSASVSPGLTNRALARDSMFLFNELASSAEAMLPTFTWLSASTLGTNWGNCRMSSNERSRDFSSPDKSCSTMSNAVRHSPRERCPLAASILMAPGSLRASDAQPATKAALVMALTTPTTATLRVIFETSPLHRARLTNDGRVVTDRTQKAVPGSISPLCLLSAARRRGLEPVE